MILLALIKKKKGEQVTTTTAVKKSAVFRKGHDFSEQPEDSEEFAEQPQAEALEPEVEEEPPFEQTLISPPPATGKVVGTVRRSSEARPSTLPPLEKVVVGGDKPPPPPPPDPADLDEEIMAEDEPPAQPAAPVGPPIDEQILEEARQQAAQIMQEAQMQAKQMIEQTAQQTQQAAEQARQQAQEQGYQEGLEAGRKAGYESSVGEFVERIAQAKDMFVQLVKARRQVLAEVEPQLARLSVKIAERLIGEELKINQEAILGVVRQCMSVMKDREEVTVRVNPSDWEMVKQHQASFERLVEGLKDFKVLSDGAVDIGGCVVETNLGNIDARLTTRLDAIRSGIEETAKLREEELREQAANAPVDVPGDPDFQGLEQPQEQIPEAEDFHDDEHDFGPHEGQAEHATQMEAPDEFEPEMAEMDQTMIAEGDHPDA